MKIHLRKGPNFPSNSFALCGHNHKRGDGVVPLECVSPEKFKQIDEKFLCHHCKQLFIKKRNDQRKKNGKSPIFTFTN